MRDERFEVTVTFDERCGYVASAPELRHPIVALSLASLRKRIEIALLPDDVRVALHLDGLAERVGAPTKQNCAQGVRVLDPNSDMIWHRENRRE